MPLGTRECSVLNTPIPCACRLIRLPKTFPSLHPTLFQILSFLLRLLLRLLRQAFRPGRSRRTAVLAMAMQTAEGGSSSTAQVVRDQPGSEEPEPTELCTNSVGHAIVVERDRLTVRYTGDGRHTSDVGAVQANRPVPKRRLIYYFEVTVLDEGMRAKVAVGFADKTFKLNRQPG